MRLSAFFWCVTLILTAQGLVRAADEPARRPNIVFILADDEGVADNGCYGQKDILTPNIDKIAAEGLRFTNAYSGSAVCAPSRCSLMTGYHVGHCRRRDNTATAGKDDFGKGRPLVPLEPTDLTIASVLKKAGYVTGGYGKWGLGNPGTPGTPDLHGFDHFLGYLDQVHAHDYYTDHLMNDGKEMPLPGNANGGKQTYSHDVIAAGALDFIRQNKDKPFFLYCPFTIPHANHVVPSDEPYADKTWGPVFKHYAAMITRMDKSIGQIMALLKELKLDENTIVFYTSDNGATQEFIKQFHSSGEFRGQKRDLYEGGIRCPMLVRWPGKIAAGATSNFAWTFYDFFPTACELVGVEAPKGLDGLSVLPTILGKTQSPHEFLYFEIYEPRFAQAVRMGNWKGIRFGTQTPLELYDLSKDVAEKTNLASQNPEIVKKIEAVINAQHVDTKYWPTLDKPKAGGKKKGAKEPAE